MELKDKRILITGASSRLGYAMALSLARFGVKLILHYNRSSEQMERCITSILAEPGISDKNISTLCADFGEEDQVNDFFDKACALYGGIDILINNASIYPGDEGQGENNFSGDKILKINTGIPLYFSHLLSAGTPSETSIPFASRVIINMLDTRISDQSLPSDSTYLISKRRLAIQTKKLAWELAPHIRVNGIAPGLILPPPGLIEEGEQYLQERRKFNPLLMTPSVENIIEALLFLLRSDSITGQTIFVDGGRHLKEFAHGS